jgi:sulfide dehydrogenase [flavocytochrome c] flavoprotein subunit
VIGGGFAGATCARTLRALAPGADIVLIEPRPAFYTGPFTNAAVASLCTEGDILRSPAALAAANIRWLRERVVALDPVTRRVRTDRGTELAADRIVVAPGVAMRWDRIAGLDATTTDAMPHAWLGDAQVPRLRERIEALRDGATLAIAAPPNPYRCPPGPYERAALLAWRFGQTARRRIKILILDAKDDFTKHALFVSGWDALYPGVIEWVPRAKGGEVVRVDPRRGTLHLAGGSTVRATLASVVPPQQAAQLAHDADLADETRWCPIDPVTFESTRHAGIHVIGDAAAGAPMPKSAFSANSQAKQAALAIAAALSHTPPPDVRLVNTCYSLLAPDYGISVGGLYGAAAGRLSALSEGMSPAGAPQEVRAREAGYARDWYRRITRDAFG